MLALARRRVNVLRALVEPVIIAWKDAHPSVSGHQGRYEMREIVNALLCQGRAGCQWDLLPHDSPPPGAVKYYLYIWRDDGTDQTVVDDADLVQAPGAEFGLAGMRTGSFRRHREEDQFESGGKVQDWQRLVNAASAAPTAAHRQKPRRLE